MSVTSLQDETASVVNVNNSIVDNMNIVSISKPDNDLPFVEEVHHNRMRRNADSLKSAEVIRSQCSGGSKTERVHYGQLGLVDGSYGKLVTYIDGLHAVIV